MTDQTPEKAGPSLSKAELFELLIESSEDFAIFTTDLKGATTSWNSGAERLFGFAGKEILNGSADVIFTPEDRRAGAAEEERQRARRDGRATDERWHQRKDGSRFWASGLMMLLKDGSGFLKITRDRTERHQAGKSLRESEARFRLLATSIPQLVFQTRHSGWRTWGSPQWIGFTGLSLEESLGLGWIEAVHPDDREETQAAWHDAAKAGEYYCEHRVRRAADQDYRWHQTRARPIDGKDPTTGEWVGTMTDIHELRGLKDRQQVLMAELQHRTRNLLALVQSIASQTMRSSDSLQTFRTEFESRLRALSRVQGLLARGDDEDIDLHTLLTVELTAHGDGQTESGKIVIEGPPAALPPASAQVLALALHELATNAVKYGALAQASGRLAVRWTLDPHGPEPRILLEWQESGVTMPEAGVPRRKGYGSELIARALPYQLRTETQLEFGPDGVRCAIIVPARANRKHGA